MRVRPHASNRVHRLLLVVVVLTLASTAHAEDDIVADEARARYRRGIELFDEGDFRLALVELERAYSLHPSYKILYNIAQVHFQLNEYAKARLAFERYLEGGRDEIPAERRAEVERELATLRTRVATLTVHANVEGADVLVNDQPIGRAPIERMLVDAGSLRVQASRAGYAARVRVVQLAGGDETVVELELTRAAPDVVVTSDGLSGLAIGGWITTGVLAAGSVGFGIAASAAASRYDAKRETPIAGSPADAAADLESQRSLVRGLALTTDILIGATIAAAGVSLWLTLRKPSPRTPQLQVAGRSVQVGVRF